MKIPRSVSAKELINSLGKIGYSVSRQAGSHIRLTATTSKGTHHVTIPNHNPIKIGTLSSILKEVASYKEITKEELFRILFG
jgi:predicted RNA binding protein YcfA (HicA-like mRNA interferase family)